MIQRARKIKGLSQTDVATALGISVPTIYRVETDKPGVEIETIARVAKHLDLEFDWATGKILRSASMPADSFVQADTDARRIVDYFLKEIEFLIDSRALTADEVVERFKHYKPRLVGDAQAGTVRPGPTRSDLGSGAGARPKLAAKKRGKG